MAITKSLDVSAVASATSVSVKQQNQQTAANLRPEIIVCIGQAQTGKNVDTSKLYLASGNPDDAGVVFGFGSPLHRQARKLFPKAGNGSKVETYYLPVAAPENGAAAVKTITVTVAETGIKKTVNGYFRFKDQIFEAAADVAGKVATNAHNNPAKAPRGTILNSYEITKYPFSLSKGMTAAKVAEVIKEALDDYLELPFTMAASNGVLTLTSKWVGSDSLFDFDIVDDSNEANPITQADCGVSFAIATATESAGVGSISDAALALLTPELGVTRVVSQYATETVLDKLQDKFEAWHDGLTAQYVLCYSAIKAPESEDVEGTYDLALLIENGNKRRNDSINVQLVGDFGELRTLEYGERDRLLKAGYSHLIRLADGAYKLMDLSTFYHPVGNSNPLYRFDRDVTVVGNIAYDLMYCFRDTEEWKSVIIAADGDVTTNPDVRTLKDVKAAVNTRISLLGLAGMIANYKKAQENTQVEIDQSNPNRLNINPKFEITGVGRIFDFTNFIGFYFGG